MGPPAGGGHPVSGVGESFRSEHEKSVRAGEVEGGTAPGAQATGQATGRAALLRAWAEDLRAGRIDPRQAVDRVIERALTTGLAAALPPVRRAELEALLRGLLAEDPTLVSMQKDLARDG